MRTQEEKIQTEAAAFSSLGAVRDKLGRLILDITDEMQTLEHT